MAAASCSPLGPKKAHPRPVQCVLTVALGMHNIWHRRMLTAALGATKHLASEYRDIGIITSAWCGAANATIFYERQKSNERSRWWPMPDPSQFILGPARRSQHD